MYLTVHETCEAIIRKFKSVYISLPTGENLKPVIPGFYYKLNIPRCTGSADGSQMPISPAAMNHFDYYNHKGWYSIIVQAVVDRNGSY